MLKKISFAVLGLLLGVAIGIYFLYFKLALPQQATKPVSKQVVGFLPYWQLDQGNTDYSNYITTLTYFGLNADGTGHIVKLSTPQEENPGWNGLTSGELTPYLTSAQNHHIKLSLLISSGDASAIQEMISKPTQNADNLIHDVAPLMKKYDFQDLNLDVEYSSKASSAEQQNFTAFVKEIKQQLINRHLGTLTIEITPYDAIVPNLIDIPSVSQYADSIILMAYDYHSSISYVTGPVAPLNGAGVDAEYDVTTAVEKTIQMVPTDKIILGMPLYGYEWQTLSTALHSAIIPGTGVIASNNRIESFLSSCATCSAFFDTESQEEYVVYQDQDTGTFHQIFFPNQQSVVATIKLADQKQLGGVALWSLGYEGKDILQPLTSYK